MTLYAILTLLLLLACSSLAECGEEERHLPQSHHIMPQSRVLSHVQPLTPVDQSGQSRPMANLPQRAVAQFSSRPSPHLPQQEDYPSLPSWNNGQMFPTAQQLPSSSAFAFDMPVGAADISQRRFTAPELPSVYQSSAQRLPQYMRGRTRHQPQRARTRKAETATPPAFDPFHLAGTPEEREVLYQCHFCPMIFVSTEARDLHHRTCDPSAIAPDLTEQHDLPMVLPDPRAQQWRQKVKEMSRWVDHTRSQMPALESEKHRMIEHEPWQQNLYLKTYQKRKEEDAFPVTGESS